MEGVVQEASALQPANSAALCRQKCSRVSKHGKELGQEALALQLANSAALYTA